MPDLFLIAHKVRSEPAFDIACQMECPHCHPQGEWDDHSHRVGDQCIECDGLGYWWIIPTSGHRAYPYWSYLFERVLNVMMLIDKPPTSMPPSLPDHYHTRAAPTISLIDTLGLRKPKPQASTVPIARRF